MEINWLGYLKLIYGQNTLPDTGVPLADKTVNEMYPDVTGPPPVLLFKTVNVAHAPGPTIDDVLDALPNATTLTPVAFNVPSFLT